MGFLKLSNQREYLLVFNGIPQAQIIKSIIKTQILCGNGFLFLILRATDETGRKKICDLKIFQRSHYLLITPFIKGKKHFQYRDYFCRLLGKTLMLAEVIKVFARQGNTVLFFHLDKRIRRLAGTCIKNIIVPLIWENMPRVKRHWLHEELIL